MIDNAPLNAKRQWNRIFDIRFFTGRNALAADSQTRRFVSVVLPRDQNISFTRYCTKYEMDDGDASLQYVQRRRAGGELRARRLREVVYDALARELPELAMPAPGADLVAVVLQHRKHSLTH